MPASERVGVGTSAAASLVARWEKRGLLFAAPAGVCLEPLPRRLCRAPTRAPDGTIDLYYSPRDELGRAHVARAPG